MAITPTFTETFRQRGIAKSQVAITGYLTTGGSDTYATGGFAISASTFGLGQLADLHIHGIASDGTNALVPWFDRTNSKIKLFEGGATANANPFDQKGNTEGVANYVIQVTAYGS